MTGGGSGGHITPLLAVAAEIKKVDSNIQIVYIGQRGDRFADIVSADKNIDATHRIFAGKFRRYHGEGWKQLLDVKTIVLNARDAFYVLFGTAQMLWLLRRIAPKKVFIKGGFVGVPVGLSAAFWRIPYITHDSDAIAGLANRIIARWAALHAVALPKNTYTYPQNKTVTVGVPIASEYQLVTGAAQEAYKQEIGIPKKSKLILVTGGGLGSQLINESVVEMSKEVLIAHPDAYIVHTAGHVHKAAVVAAYKQILNKKELQRVAVHEYLKGLYAYSGAADVVIARAGATNMAEFASQGKACVIVPSPFLAGGHQLRNAEVYANARAVSVIQQDDLEADASVLTHAVQVLLNDDKKRQTMAKQLHSFAYPDSAQKLAGLLLDDDGSK